MRASTLPMFLIGDEKAILRIARSRLSILCGVLFVISAGFAREYDGEDLVHEPWHVLRPLAASFVSGATLFFMLYFPALPRSGKGEGVPGRERAYVSFMSLFWMTAPLAWLYAIPYERFLEPIDAITMNLLTLGLVSFWRVTLITRAASVAFGLRFGPVFFLVMLFADAVTFVVMLVAPLPVIDLMGGLRQSAEEEFVSGIVALVFTLCIVTAPVWIVGSLVSLFFMKAKWTAWARPVAPDASRGLLILAAASVVFWAPILPFTQAEQARRAEVESLFAEGDVSEGLRVMSSHSRGAYPPHWDPTAALEEVDRPYGLARARDAIYAERPADWVLLHYVEMQRDRLREYLDPYGWEQAWEPLVRRAEESGAAAQRYPEATQGAQFLLDFDPELSEEDRAALHRFLVASPG